MLNLNPKQRPSGEFVAKQLNKILQYVVEKGQHAIDFDALMTPQPVHSKEALAASNLVNEGLSVFAKEYISQNPLSGDYGDDDDLLIVDNNEEFDFDDDDEDEFEDIDDIIDKRDRSSSLNNIVSNSKINAGKSYNTITASSFRQIQQLQSAKLESQIQSLEEEMKSRKDNHTYKQVVHDITNVDHPIQKTIEKTAIVRSNSSASNPNGLVLKGEPLPLRTKQGLVLYCFEPENPGELAVDVDDLVEVLSIKGEWVECLTKDRRHGWVPFNYVHIQE
jgi:glycyl-tRNA synthetase beta subunit